jgi:hypothetical protein
VRIERRPFAQGLTLMGSSPSGRDVLKQLAIARMAVGVAALAAPKTVGRAWIGAEGASPAVAMVTRAFAVRDFALGLGAYLATQKDAPVRGWIEAGLLSDAVDVVSTLRGPAPLTRKLMIAATGLAAVVGGLIAIQDLDRATAPTAG